MYQKYPYIKIFNSGIIDTDFEPSKYNYLDSFLQDAIYNTLLSIKCKINKKIPKFIRIEIIKWLVKIS